MKNLVRRTNFRVACDIYTCNNMAMFEIGHEFTTHNNMLLCEDCMREILEEGRNILAELYQKRVEENEKNSPDELGGEPDPEDKNTEDEKNEEISKKDEIKTESATEESVSVENVSDISAAEEHPEEKDAEEKSIKTKKRPSRKSSVVKENE